MRSILHPALWELTRLRASGKIRSMLDSFCKPRKLAVSILGAVLALIWLGNAIASVLFREQYAPESFRAWMTMMLTVYALWHIVRVAWQKPEASFDWSPAEQSWLIGSPLARRDLIQYRLFTVLSATTIKATIGSILLLPDLPTPWLGFFGLWAALAMIELIRISCDTFAFGLGEDGYRSLRACMIVTGASVLSALSVQAMDLTRIAQLESKLPTFILFLKSSFTVAENWIASPAGIWVSAPFLVFIDLIMTTHLSWMTALNVGTTMTMIGSMVLLVQYMDRWSCKVRRQREQDEGRISAAIRSAEEQDGPIDIHLPKTWIASCGGGVAWRQLVGLNRYRTGALIALLPPAILAAMPLLMRRVDDQTAVVNFLGGLTFYSFLLLPSAMKFDFRRDYDHLLLLKMLPMSPSRVVIGQLMTPVIATTAFQYFMLGVAVLIRGIDAGILWAAVASFPVMNLAIYGWENLLFLLFPQRLKQEGIEVFLRTTVIFTAKGIAFALLFALLFVWAMVSGQIADQLGEIHTSLADRRVIFGLGLWTSIATISVILTGLTARRFKKLDPVFSS